MKLVKWEFNLYERNSASQKVIKLPPVELSCSKSKLTFNRRPSVINQTVDFTSRSETYLTDGKNP